VNPDGTGGREAIGLVAVSKDYRGLRPLRIEELVLAVGEHVAILGLDPPAVPVLVDLIMGAILPDHGDVRIFGQPSAGIADADAWLATIDRFGIVSDRAVLLDGLSAIQNLAMPFSLDIEPPSDQLRVQAAAVAIEIGLPESCWDQPVGSLGPVDRFRLRLGRAVALGPSVLILEHPTVGLPPESSEPVGQDVRRIADARGAATITLTADRRFASAVAPRVLTVEPSTGRLRPPKRFGLF
jgi:branched-chain amino acid transport system ATP-binding protein